MKADFSLPWKSSTQRRKQRKFRFNAPKHIRTRFMGAPLSKLLQEKNKVKTLPLRKGDKVRVMKGEFKKKEGKVTSINRTKEKVYIDSVDRTRKDGNKAFIPFHPSNLLILELEEDKRRIKGAKK